MTIARVRELLSDEVANLSDDEVAVMIARDSQMMKELISVFDKFLTIENKEINNGNTYAQTMLHLHTRKQRKTN